jgi:quercetin dioxygenase-like cupin family protein
MYKYATMEIKYNDSTNNRPFGERPIDAPFVPIDLQSFTAQLMVEEAWQKNDRNAITVYKTDEITIVLVALHKDAEMRPGNFEGTGTMSLQVLDGRLNFKTGMDAVEINLGQMAALHGHVPYSATALDDSICLLTMTRENK